jgi:SulP family sulfate permease
LDSRTDAAAIKTDIIAGLLTAILMIASTISYSAAIFSGSLTPYLQIGIGYGLIGAFATALIFALFSRIPFVIAGPDSKPTAILSVLTASVAAATAARGDAGSAGAMVLIALIVGTILTGVVLLIFGFLRMGRWVRFVPYPVIGGFMSASGWLLIAGAIRLLTQVEVKPETIAGLFRAGPFQHLLAGVVFAIAIELVSRRSKHPLAFPALLLGGGAAIHVALWWAGLSVPQAQNTGWLLKVPAGAVLPMVWVFGHLPTFRPADLYRFTGDYAALIVVTAITLLLSVTAVEVDTEMEHDVDADWELRVNGVANIVAGLLGGMIGTLSLSRTLFNYRNGGTRRTTGIIAAVACLATLALGSGALGYTPVPLLAGMLLRLGWGLLDDWLFNGWKRMQAVDYVQVVVILLAIVQWGFLAGISVGVVVACITFAVNSSRIRIVRLELNRSRYASRVERSAADSHDLMRHGNGIQIIWLHGFVFFGSANRLLIYVRELVTAQGPGVCRMLILSCNEVLGLDTSAVMCLIKMRQLAARESFVIVLAGLPPAVGRTLRAGGFLRDNDPLCRLFPEVDTALEWCEERVLEQRTNRDDVLRSTDEWLTREMGSHERFLQLVSRLELLECAPGDYLFRQGDPAEFLCLIYSGRVSVMFRAPDGQEVRVRSMVRQTLVGEMGVYRSVARGASVLVDEPTVVYRLTRAALDRLEQDDPGLAYAFHKFVVRTVADRLDFANREVAALQR